MEKILAIKGGEFMVKETEADEIFIPEEFDEEQKMIAETCQDFLDTEVMPNLDRIDNQEEGLMRSLLEKAGELGLLGISLPEEYDGFGQSFVTSMLSCEIMGCEHTSCTESGPYPALPDQSHRRYRLCHEGRLQAALWRVRHADTAVYQGGPRYRGP